MIVYRKELKRTTGSWCIWAFALVFIQSFICLFLFPEVKEQISKVNDALENVEELIIALGMGHLRLDEITDFYGLICGMVLGIGGSLFAALKGACILEAEEEDGTADFLFTHPISRAQILVQKLLSLFTQAAALNAVVIGAGLLTARIIDEAFDMHRFILLHTAYLAMQLEIACICFGISAFLKKGGGAIGAALVCVLYAMGIVYNLSGKAGFLKYVTPYAYCKVGRILSESNIQTELIGIGLALGVVGITAAFLKYVRKDISAEN